MNADIELIASPYAGSAVAVAKTERGLHFLNNRHNTFQGRATIVGAAAVAELQASVGAFTPAIVIVDARVAK
jgi:hypothetical protein